MKEIDWLQEAVFIEASIQCTCCRIRQGETNTDEFSFTENMAEQGWRTTSQNVYCPSCAKKKLKPRK